MIRRSQMEELGDLPIIDLWSLRPWDARLRLRDLDTALRQLRRLVSCIQKSRCSRRFVRVCEVVSSWCRLGRA
jgi:hypothetical protein